MNAEILRRVVRAIHIGSQPDLERLASKIVDNERRTGHARLADELQAILKQPRGRGGANASRATCHNRDATGKQATPVTYRWDVCGCWPGNRHTGVLAGALGSQRNGPGPELP